MGSESPDLPNRETDAQLIRPSHSVLCEEENAPKVLTAMQSAVSFTVMVTVSGIQCGGSGFKRVD